MDIKIQNLKKIYNGNTVLDIDNLGVAKGELIGLVGNNGAGKTTLLRLILDLIQADDGFVESNGQKVNESETWKEYTGTVIISSHNLNFVTDISSRILLLEKGKLVKDLPNVDGAAIAELNEYFGIQAE